MDMSKLPRLSDTQREQKAHAAAVGAASSPPSHPAPAPVQTIECSGAEVWISIAIGVLLLLMFRRLPQYIFHVLFGSFFAPYTMPDGTVVPYTSTLDFWSDLGVTSFAIVLILEGVAIALVRRRGVVMVAFVLTCLVTLYNLGYLVMTFDRGLAIVSAFAVAFGVYIAMGQWRILRTRAYT